MATFEATFEIEKETKNTYRYAVKTEGEPPAVTTIYIAKWFLGSNPPKRATPRRP